ncbi:hypothetical protein MFIFM68171_10691 [Madurella fahalii]|uniref:Zn(2)-C6 fungal-type domain-containing protein n=1 Tax=Madurella fahalii TaxID=1157608 RepID=A0ABQ0GRW7_9PEZI
MVAPRRVTAFTNTFLVHSIGGGGPVLEVVGPEDVRKKRPHRKSRLGCIRCKRRKVKCDEGEPCGNCVKRNETCIRRQPPRSKQAEGNSQPSTPSPPRDVAWCPLSEPECGPINLLHMELLHHFERFTIDTLSFQEVWPRMLQLAFQHTYLINAMLSLAAAHLDYLVPGNPRYHRAKDALLSKALHDYRETLSHPITADNCDALLGTATLIHFLMWCDLSFMEGQACGQHRPLDLSGDRLYWLSTGVRQIFFMAWPLFQTSQSVFMHVPLLQPCMALEELVDARGLNWQRFARGFMDLYDNPRYRGARNAFPASEPPSDTTTEVSPSPCPSFPSTPGGSSNSISGGGSSSSSEFLEGIIPSLPSSSALPFKVMTLWQSFKEGEAYVKSAGACDEALMRVAYKRLAARLAVAMAYVSDRGANSCPASRAARDKATNYREPPLTQSDIVRYVSTFPMMCFGPLLALISSGDSRILVVLFHIYRVVRVLLPGEQYWWCRRRVEVMEEAIGRELSSRGLEVCLKRRDEVA